MSESGQARSRLKVLIDELFAVLTQGQLPSGVVCLLCLVLGHDVVDSALVCSLLLLHEDGWLLVFFFLLLCNTDARNRVPVIELVLLFSDIIIILNIHSLRLHPGLGDELRRVDRVLDPNLLVLVLSISCISHVALLVEN